MSVHDELTTAQRCLDDLFRALGRLEQQMGSGGLDIRRVHADADHLRESMALLRAAVTTRMAPSPKRPDLLTISDTPYDTTMWRGAEDEGLGAQHGPDR